jgi:hypothetical protein
MSHGRLVGHVEQAHDGTLGGFAQDRRTRGFGSYRSGHPVTPSQRHVGQRPAKAGTDAGDQPMFAARSKLVRFLLHVWDCTIQCGR